VAAPKKVLTIYDGTAKSFWLNTAGRGEDKKAAMDWTFTVWEAASFNRLFNNPQSTFLSDHPSFRGEVPAPEVTVYVGGQIDWAKVVVPKGIEINDQRLEAHGYNVSDGTVVEVSAWDMTNQHPVAGAELVLELISAQPEGGYRYKIVSTTKLDDSGKGVLKGAPEGWNQMIVWAEGYAPKLVGYAQNDQPRWYHYDVYLAKSHKVTGTVVDENGKAVPGAKVRIADVLGSDGKGYSTPRGLEATADESGNFVIEAVPDGFGNFRAYADDYVFKGLGEIQPLTDEPVTVGIVHAGKLKVTVQVGEGQSPENFMIEINPAEGAGIGKWGGNAQVGKDGTYTFTHIPPGSYTMSAKPNPGAENDRTEPTTVEIKGGETAQVTLKSR
jgi:hypothetical protein